MFITDIHPKYFSYAMDLFALYVIFIFIFLYITSTILDVHNVDLS